MTDELERSTVPTPSPIQLLQTALDKGMDPEKLSRLIDLVERWKAARALEDYALAMNICQREMPIVLEDAENPHTRSRYASLESVNRTCKPCYTRNGFSLQFAEEKAEQPDMIRIICDVLHSGGHERRYHIDLALDGTGSQGGKSAMNAVQGKGSTFSYGQRYLVKMIFNLTISGEDTDGNAPNGHLSDEQTVTLNELLADLHDSYGTDEEKWEAWKGRFWKWLGCTSMDDMKAASFDKARLELERLKKERRK